MKLAFSKKVQEDIKDIGDFIAEVNPFRAVTFAKEIIDHCQKICRIPRGYPVYPGIVPAIKIARYHSYLIFYRESDKEVYIERVIHGARDYESLI